ncbi:MAG TPA: ThiF family adenylyltransferase [Methanosarcina sp.]|nr:ThiF family adenylyltransferase [Methanosarcina sp.]
MFVFTPRQIPNQIFVVGGGGTGSRLIPMLAQFIKTMTHGLSPRGTIINPVIYLVDDDIVEQKNLARQNFIEADVGKPKAAVLAARYSRAFGVNIIPIVERIKDVQFFNNDILRSSSFAGPQTNSLLILCVDSAAARRDILNAWGQSGGAHFTHMNAPFVIDAGNEDNFGQVRFFNLIGGSKDTTTQSMIKTTGLKMTPMSTNIECIPMDFEFYANLKDNQAASCADLDQTLAINALMATLIMGVVQNFYYMKPVSYCGLSVSLDGSTFTETLSLARLDQITGTGRVVTGSEFAPMSHTVFVHDFSSTFKSYLRENVKQLKSMGLGPDGKTHPDIIAAEEEKKRREAMAAAEEKRREAMAAAEEVRKAKELQKKEALRLQREEQGRLILEEAQRSLNRKEAADLRVEIAGALAEADAAIRSMLDPEYEDTLKAVSAVSALAEAEPSTMAEPPPLEPRRRTRRSTPALPPGITDVPPLVPARAST